jgi:hypothetical protein
MRKPEKMPNIHRGRIDQNAYFRMRLLLQSNAKHAVRSFNPSFTVLSSLSEWCWVFAGRQVASDLMIRRYSLTTCQAVR